MMASRNLLTCGRVAALVGFVMVAGTASGQLRAAAETVKLEPAAGVTTNVIQLFSGGTSLEVAGPGTVKLNPANSHTGGTTLSGGTLVISGNNPGGDHSPVGAETFTITGGTLCGSGTFGGNMTGTGTATILAPGGWTWTGNNTFATTNYLADGVLEIAGGTTTFSAPFYVGSPSNATFSITGGAVAMDGYNLQLSPPGNNVKSTFTMTGGSLNLNGKKILVGYQAANATNITDISGPATISAAECYVHAGNGNNYWSINVHDGALFSTKGNFYTGGTGSLDVDVSDGGAFGFVKLYKSNDKSAKMNLRVNGGILRNEKTGSSATSSEKWIGNTADSKNQLTSFTIGPKGATFMTENGDKAGIAQVYSPITAEPAGAGETAAGVTISGGRFAYFVTTAYEGPTVIKDGATLYVSSAGTIPSASAVTVEGGSMLRLLGADKTLSTLTLEDGAALGLGTNGVRAVTLTVSGTVSLPREAKIGLYNNDKLAGTANTANGTYAVFKVPASYEAALRAVRWSCATATSGKAYTFSIATSGEWATLSMTIANSTVATDTGDVTVSPGEFVNIVNSSLDVGTRTVTVNGGNLKVDKTLTGTGAGGKVIVENGGLLDVCNYVRFSSAANAYYDIFVRSGGIVRASRFQPENSNYISSKGDLLHIDGGTLQMVDESGSSNNNYQSPRFVSTYIGAGGATFDLSHWRDKGKTGWFRFTCETLSFYHDPDCVGDDGGITICGSDGDTVLYYFKSINEDSTMNGGITVADGGAISTINGLTNQTVRILPGGMFRSYQASSTATITNLVIGEANATKPVELVVCKASEKPTIAVTDTLSVLSPVEINVAQEWRYDASLVSGVYTALVYQASCSVEPSLFQLPAGSPGTFAAREVTLSGGDYDGWKALVVTIDNAIAVTGSASYPTSKTVSADVSCDSVIVGGAWNGEAAPAVDTSLTISGNVKASSALYMGYNPAAGASAADQHQGTLTIENGATLSVPAVYSAYREVNDSNAPRYGSEITVNGGLLDVSGNVRFGNHWSRYGEKIYSRLTVNGGRVSVGGTFYLSYWWNSNGNRTMPGCIVLNDGEVDVKGKIDLSRNKVEGNDIVSYANCFGVFLNGGVLKAENIMMTTNAAKPKVVFNGGTYMPYGAAAANRTMQGLAKAYVSTNGAVISTANMPDGIAYTIAQDLLQAPDGVDGGLKKIGTGALVLAGANTYTGVTEVAEGTLIVDNPTALIGRVAVDDGAVLDLDGNDVTLAEVAASGCVANGNLTVTGALVMAGDSFLSVDGDLIIEAGTKMDFGLADGEMPAQDWRPLAVASGNLSAPDSLRVRHAGGTVNRCKLMQDGGILYARPTIVGTTLSFR